MAGFGFDTDGIDVVQAFSGQVKGKVFLITGPSQGGLGAETAISLAHGSPSIIILVGRSLTKIQPVIDSIKAINASVDVKFFKTDLSSLSSVRQTARNILGDNGIHHIDAIINNAAIMASPLARSVDGLEMQLTTNHLSHFVLTNKLLPKLSPHGRVVNVSSVAHKYSDVQFSDPNFTDESTYSPFKGYGQAKTAIVLFSVELNRRGITSFAVNPGSIRTGLQKFLTSELRDDATKKVFPGESAGKLGVKTLQQGCATQLRAALDPSLDSREGVYMNDCVITADPFWVLPYALDPIAAGRCWKMSENLTGEEF